MCMETNLFEYFGLDREDSDRVFIIAEMSANHNHDFNIAVETVKAAKAAGADAIKLQTYTADTLTLDCDNAYFQIKQDTLWVEPHCINYIRTPLLLGNGNLN